MQVDKFLADVKRTSARLKATEELLMQIPLVAEMHRRLQEAEARIAELEGRISPDLSRSVDTLKVSVRTYNGLKNAGIQTIADLVAKTGGDLIRIRNFGRRSLQEVREVLAELGLKLADH